MINSKHFWRKQWHNFCTIGSTHKELLKISASNLILTISNASTNTIMTNRVALLRRCWQVEQTEDVKGPMLFMINRVVKSNGLLLLSFPLFEILLLPSIVHNKKHTFHCFQQQNHTWLYKKLIINRGTHIYIYKRFCGYLFCVDFLDWKE